VAGYLKEDEELWFDSLLCLSAVDEGENLAVVYHLFSMLHRHRFALKALVSSHNPTLPSVEHVWKAANWYEREAYDLMGIRFDGHPDLRRILLPDDWPGHPLRKDYVFPDEYDGIPCMRE
jgi:NADH-quinone oxidoreductase subunit C